MKIKIAAGIDRNYRTTIKKISLGDITLYDVPDSISTHDFPTYPLLGMSFLSQLEMNQKDSEMTLSHKK